MKKYFISLGLIVAAAFTLTNCTQEIANPVEPTVDGVPFEIVASPAVTKTANDGMSTVWAEGDALNLFHVETGETSYVSDGEFKFNGENSFKGTLTEELKEGSCYDWYAFYPYSKYIKTPANTSSGYMPVGSQSNESQTQTGNNSMAHIAGGNYPLAGKVLDTEYEAGTPVSIAMSHLTSLLEIVVTNNSDEDLTVENVSFTAPDYVVGTYYIDFTGETPAFKSSGDNYVSKTAKLSVKSAEALAKGQSAKYYLAVKPFTAETGKKLAIVVNDCRKEITLSSDLTFTSGKIKTLNFSYEEAPETDALTLPWYEDFSAKDLSNYVVVNGESDTKLYFKEEGADILAGGESPEILIGKSNGSFSVTLATGGYVGDLVLSFKSNHADYLEVTSVGATVSKVSDFEYRLTVAEGVDQFTVTLKNTKTSNTRVDNIEIAKPRASQTLTFANEIYNFTIGSADLASFTGQTVSGAKTTVTYASDNEDVATVNATTGAVTLTGATGTAVITASAAQTPEYKGASAAYSINVSNPNATVTEKTVTYNFGTDKEVGFSSWGSSYSAHTANYTDATVKFGSANKQSGTITNMPVTKGQPVEIVMKDNRTLKSFKLKLKQWTTKAQTVTLNYSINGGATYTSTTTKSTNFTLEGTLPEGTNAIKFTFSSSSNQVGIESCELIFDHAE